MGEAKNELYGILDELYESAQELKSFCYVLKQLEESYPVTGAAEIKSVITCCRIYVDAVERQVTEQLDVFDDDLLTDW